MMRNLKRSDTNKSSEGVCLCPRLGKSSEPCQRRLALAEVPSLSSHLLFDSTLLIDSPESEGWLYFSHLLAVVDPHKLLFGEKKTRQGCSIGRDVSLHLAAQGFPRSRCSSAVAVDRGCSDAQLCKSQCCVA